jgi:hypothetical protein
VNGLGLAPTDGPLVRYAVVEQGLTITGRRRWQPQVLTCPGCHVGLSREEYRQHRCGEKLL